MTRPAIAALILEITLGIAAQASGVGGPVAIVVAVALALATIVYLVRVSKTGASLVDRLRVFAAERKAGAPIGDDQLAYEDYELDTFECFRRTLAPAVSKRTRVLRRRGAIGSREQGRLNNPQSLDDIEKLANRLAEYEDRL